MKTKLLSIVAASMLLSGVANAADKFVAVGYSSANVDSASSSGAMLEFGVRGGENFKHTVAAKIAFTGENDDWRDGQGNIMEAYYALGYEVFDSAILSAKIGGAFQSLGNFRSGNESVSATSKGVSYGAIATYEINDYFDVSASYTQANLSYLELDYTMDVMDVSVAFKF